MRTKQNKTPALKMQCQRLTVFYTPSKAWVTFPAPPSVAHTACLIGSNWVHFTAAAVLGGPPMVLTSKNAGVSCCNWAALLPVASSGLSSWCQASILPTTFQTRGFHCYSSCAFTSGLSSARLQLLSMTPSHLQNQ